MQENVAKYNPRKYEHTHTHTYNKIHTKNTAKFTYYERKKLGL